MKKRKVCVVTGSRAEYGHLYWLIKAIKDDPALQLQLVVTGMHLSSKFGLTYKVIQKDGFRMDAKVNILRYANTDKGISKSIGLGCILFADAFDKLKPDMMLVCGDRYEILAAVISAHMLKIPIVHLHGGENSEGAVDEAIRHSITKMSYIHFAATESYRKRIIQLGEEPKRVFNYGAPGLDNVYKLKLLTRASLENYLNFSMKAKTALVTYHPVTLEKNSPKEQAHNLFKALKQFDINVLFTKANADSGGEIINREIQIFCKKNPERYRLFDNLGQLRYLSCLKHCALMVGNSSSGLVEAGSFKLPAVNIGDRQKARIKSRNVIDVGYSAASIKKGITLALSDQFHTRIRNVRNPYAKYKGGQTSFKIKEKLKSITLDEKLFKKTFYNL